MSRCSFPLLFHRLFFSFPIFLTLTGRFFYVMSVATYRETNAADSRSGFVIASDAVMHHTKVDGKRIAQPL